MNAERLSGLIVLGLVVAGSVCLYGQAPGQPPLNWLPASPEAVARWKDLRFGAMITWGPAALRQVEIGWARGWQVPASEYDQLYREFDAPQFNADAWAQAIKDAGMRYIIVLARHLDGFCLWNTQTTDYNVMRSPLGRDVLQELAAACRRADLPFGVYYSIANWYEPDYNTFNTHGGPGYSLPAGQVPDMERFQEYVHRQITELSRNYGPLVGIWFDSGWESPWNYQRGLRVLEVVRQLEPDVMVNDRLGGAILGPLGHLGDYGPLEQSVDNFNLTWPWESTVTLGKIWSWTTNDPIKSVDICVDSVVRVAGGDGNLLLNIAPRPDGRIEPHQVSLLREVGQWMERHGESIYGTRGGPFKPGQWGASTRKGTRIYLHILEWIWEDELRLPPLPTTILSARGLTGGAVRLRREGETAFLRWAQEPDELDAIIVLELDSPADQIAPCALPKP